MNDKFKRLMIISTILLLTGCTGQETTQSTGVLVKNELSTEIMQPGGSVLLRSSVNNFFDNELREAMIKIVRSFGQLQVNGPNPASIGTVQANPNATSRFQWTLDVRETASSGTEFTNKVRLCFKYNQTAWHELSLVNSFDIESEINSGTETGPLKITFAGLDSPYVYNEQVQSQIPISVSIKDDYEGFVGTISASRDEIPVLSDVVMRIYDNEVDGEASHFNIIDDFTNPACGEGQTTGCFICSGYQPEGFIECRAKDLQVFGDETFIGTKLNVKQLVAEELIQLIEVMVSFDYCVESDDFTLTVFTPGG